MDRKTYSGTLAEIQTMLEFTRNDYHVFNQISGKAPFDLIVVKDHEIKRISVKSVSTKANTKGKYRVELRRIRSNKHTNKIYKIVENEFDLLSVFIEETNKIVILSISEIIGKSTIYI